MKTLFIQFFALAASAFASVTAAPDLENGTSPNESALFSRALERRNGQLFCGNFARELSPPFLSTIDHSTYLPWAWSRWIPSISHATILSVRSTMSDRYGMLIESSHMQLPTSA